MGCRGRCIYSCDMQCPNCHFHNMPGSDTCGRCGSPLRLAAAAAIDVHPPRAGRVAKSIRPTTYAIGRMRRCASDTISRPYFGLLSAMPSTDAIPWALVVRMSVPGWPQMYLGYRARGHVLLWSYAVLLLTG